MHNFLDNFEQDGKYSESTDKKSLNISSLKTDSLNLDSSSGFYRDSERAHDVQTECTFCGGVNHSAEQCFKRIRK